MKKIKQMMSLALSMVIGISVFSYITSASDIVGENGQEQGETVNVSAENTIGYWDLNDSLVNELVKVNNNYLSEKHLDFLHENDIAKTDETLYECEDINGDIIDSNKISATEYSKMLIDEYNNKYSKNCLYKEVSCLLKAHQIFLR